MTNIIDLSSLLGEVKTYERTVHGRNVIIDDILFEDVPKYEKIFDGATFEAVYDATWAILRAAEVKGGLDQEWFDSIPHGEAVELILFAMSPGVERESSEFKPSPLRISSELEILLPPFTLGDAKAFYESVKSDDKRGSQMMLERFSHVLDKATKLDGSPLPAGALSGLKQREVTALITYYVNREAERDAGNVETPEARPKPKRSGGKKLLASSSAPSRSTTSKEVETAS